MEDADSQRLELTGLLRGLSKRRIRNCRKDDWIILSNALEGLEMNPANAPNASQPDARG
jgi:hypothetical protein